MKKVRKTSSENAGEVFARATFFDFSLDASRETPTFETIFGRPWSETGLKSKRFVRGCPKTRKNTHIPRERRPEPKATTLPTKCLMWNYPTNPADPPETVAATVAPTLPNTRAGGQDDGSSRNSLERGHMSNCQHRTVSSARI